MTNQEAMRGTHEGITRELIDAVGVLPDLASKREMKIWSYFMQEVASRDARIAELRKLFAYVDHPAGCIAEQFRKGSDIGCSCGLSEILKALDEALKEQP